MKSLDAKEKEITSLKDQVEKSKELVDLAKTQASDMSYLRDMEVKEKQILKAAIKELQMESDDKLLIGNLHQHIVKLQMDQIEHLRSIEKLQEKCLRLEHENVQVEKALDDRESTLFQMRIDHKMRTRMLQNTISEARAKMAGSISIEKFERACELVQILDRQKMTLTQEKNEYEDSKKKLQDQLSDSLFKIKSKDELIETLKDPSTAAKRIVNWHDKMSKLQLSDLSLQRELQRAREALESTNRELNVSMARVTQVEEELVALQVNLICNSQHVNKLE